MEGQLTFWFEIEMELKLIQVDPDELFGFFDHCLSPKDFLEGKGK
jgi:hypothetical protein